MGGSVVTRAVPRLQEAGYRVSGVAVLDVVEGESPILFLLLPPPVLLFLPPPFVFYVDRDRY